MAFEKVPTQQVDFPALERAILEWWQRREVFEKLRKKNQNGPRWSFLDGPITANNPMGVHHAWGRTYKDAFQRYHAMNGKHLRYQNGFDCQGLWVEVEVEKELKLHSKRDIEELVPGDTFASIDYFVQQCKARVDKYARVQTEQSIRLGYWMDWDREEDWRKPPDQRRSYFTMSEENNYTIWTFLKKCHNRGLIYRGLDAMPWCPRCSVGLSQMEMAEGYQLVAHRAVFVRFPLRGRPGENLLIWTTTPWTLTSNVAAAVNPGLTYLKVRHKEQIYYLAKGAFTAQRLEEQWKRKEWIPGVPKLSTLEQHFKSKGGYEIVGAIQGADMIGWQYDGPFDELPAQQQQQTGAQAASAGRSPAAVHRVIAWKDVGETEGTGIVHIAPGCGKEDFQLSKEEGLPAVAPLDEYGVFLPGFGELTGKSALAATTTDWILDNLQQKGVLFAIEKYPHSYPHCWRCKTELLFRLVEEWFIDMSWRDEIKRVVEQVTFLPESINGKARELDWLTNMGDWMISKKRFWGLALPIWVDEETGEFEVIGSREELRERAVEGWDKFEGHTPHRPWIDLVKIRNPKTGNLMSRIPDVGNPWLDAGIVPYSTMYYNRDRAEWAKWFPADFITESFPGQFRNWFYAILAMSTMMENRPPVKVLLGHGLVRDQWDRPMHKSAGNAIPFEGAADEGYSLTDPKGKTEHYPPMGADVLRWMFARHNPAHNLDFGPIPAEEIRAKFLLKLWNVYAFFCNYARLDGFDPSAPPLPLAQRQDLDRWILSDLQHLVRTARQAFESYNVMAFCLEAERFVDDKLSNWYVRRSRRRFWKSEQGTDKQAAYQTLYTVLLTLAKLLAPLIPFLTETMYQNLKTADMPESIHLCDYPTVNEALMDAELSEQMNCLLSLVSLGLAARNSVKIKVRQPLAELKVQAGADSEERAAVERFGEQLREELNVKAVSLHDPEWGPLLTPEVKPNMKTLGPKFGVRLKEVAAAIAAADAAALAAKVREGGPIELACGGETISLEPGDLIVSMKAPEGWVGMVAGETQIALDTRITEAMADEGTARDIVRHIQNLRREANLEMEDRIALYLGTESKDLQRAITAHRDYIAQETLTVEWSSQPLTGPDVHRATVKMEGEALTIELRRVTTPASPISTSLQSSAISSIQPGGGFGFALERAWGRCRRAWLRRFRPGYVRRMAERRQGLCPNCPHDILDPRDLKLYRNVCGYQFGPQDDPFARRNRLPLARAGRAEVLFFSVLFLFLSTAVVLLGLLIHPLLLLLLLFPLASWLFVLWFFRDPERIIPADPDALLSPADGTVTHVGETRDLDFPSGRAWTISIFLSVFNVHVNRLPRSGRVTALRYYRGEFLDARAADCSVRNEQFWIDLCDARTHSLVRIKQIAGAIARRIVCWLRLNEDVRAGDRLGMIKFGSRTEVSVAAELVQKTLVKVGDRVYGGRTILLRLKDDYASHE